ncbi:MAG: paraquat-inducible protein A [Gammaproteobacteria bacterium]|nr:paraquat-inducible protein A [Gammaproteobacteria bacterium]MBU1654703.1 paraquat-inducible protein A [Gammaproteobacteria bacterium]MBU1961427.1 paraquat-inducible protein A [Gammaproteobacteria bacterium]
MRSSLRRRFPLQARVLNPLLLAAGGLLAVGVFAPLMTLEKFLIFTNEVSLYSGLRDLWVDREWFLFILIGLFSILFPLLKLLLLAAAVNLPGDRHHGPLHWLEAIGKWSMLDVFVVALLVVSVKLRGMASVQVQYGSYAFAVAVLLTMLLSRWVQLLAGRVR